MLRGFGKHEKSVDEILFHYNLHVRINGTAVRRVAVKTYNRRQNGRREGNDW
jgi:hypothetical protein